MKQKDERPVRGAVLLIDYQREHVRIPLTCCVILWTVFMKINAAGENISHLVILTSRTQIPVPDSLCSQSKRSH